MGCGSLRGGTATYMGLDIEFLDHFESIEACVEVGPIIIPRKSHGMEFAYFIEAHPMLILLAYSRIGVEGGSI